MMCPSDVHTTRLYTCLGSLVEFFCALMHNHGATSYNVAHVPALEKTMFRKKKKKNCHGFPHGLLAARGFNYNIL